MSVAARCAQHDCSIRSSIDGIKSTESAANPKFEFDKDELSTDDRNVLGQLATCMTTGALKTRTVRLVGRADIDATGTTEAGWANDRRVDLDLAQG